MLGPAEGVGLLADGRVAVAAAGSMSVWDLAKAKQLDNIDPPSTLHQYLILPQLEGEVPALTSKAPPAAAGPSALRRAQVQLRQHCQVWTLHPPPSTLQQACRPIMR